MPDIAQPVISDAPHRPDFLARLISFLRHFVQMMVVMGIGMEIFIALFRWLLTPAGYDGFESQRPLLWFGAMSVFMTAPMLVLMRYYQAHSWGQCAEMTIVMLLPPAAVAALIQVGVVVYPWLAPSTLSTSTHIMMLLGMIGLMLYRHDHYVMPRSV